ncbi:MBL fold metallo-hydrolase [Desulfococcaceae bacterium HSG9]|nr:MBL fold metallo-hydrolase [Desulfococcaceae bacterium HSG9]
MRITCWGARGSIPVSGKNYIKYGGDTTCIEIRTQSDDIIIVDAGTGIRRLGDRLLKEKHREYHIIFTHSHWDHILGFPFFAPIYVPGHQVHIHSGPFPANYAKNVIARVMHPPNFPVGYSESYMKPQIHFTEKVNNPSHIGSVKIHAIPLSHPNGGFGYKFTENGKTFVFITDNELTHHHQGGKRFEDYCEFAAEADLFLHDSEYTADDYKNTKTFGHSVYTDALELAIKAEVKRFGLFHINQRRTDDAMDEIVNLCRLELTQRKIQMDCFAVARDMTWKI